MLLSCIILLLLLIIIINNFNEQSFDNDNIRTGVYVRCKDEKNLEEFMAYYYSLGFDYIIIFDDFSNPSVKEIVNNFNFDKTKYDIIDNIKIKGNHDQMSEIFNKYILSKLKEKTDYFLYVDMDEYINIGNYKNIKELVHTYYPFDELKINWVIFGNNNKMFNDPSKLINNFTKSYKQFNQHVKCIVKTKSVIDNNNPHFFELKKNSIIKNVLNKITDNGPYEEKLKNYIFNKDNLYIAHYMVQDTNTFINRRVFRIGTNTYQFKKNGFPDFVKNNKELVLDILHFNKEYTGEQKELVNELRGWFNEHNLNEKENYDIINYI